jgi:hypothetical protein
MHDLRKKQNSGNIFEFFTVPRYDDSVIHATRIIKFLDDRFNNTVSNLHVVGNPVLHHSEQVRSGLAESVNLYTHMDVFLLADTRNPTELSSGPNRKRAVSAKIMQPFFDLTKKDTVQLCIDISQQEIMKLSHTCTESKLLRCSTCWQCRERAWAFEQCKYVDPGEM